MPAVFLAAIAGVMMHSVAAQSPGDCAAWSAWIDRTSGPGAIPALHVQGQCTFRVAGYSAALKPHLPLGADPDVYLLDLTVHAPAGPAAPRTGSARVSYRTAVAGGYSTVLLLPDRIAVPVHQVY